MKILILLSVVSFLGACATTDRPASAWRKPSSEAEVASHSLPASDISSILVLPGTTECKKGAEIKISPRAKIANPKVKTMHAYDCVTVAPVSVSINSKSLGLTNTYSGLHTLVFQGIPSTKDLTQDVELKRFHSENMDKIKTNFADIKSGCMGSTVTMNLNDKGELLSIEGSAYFGKFRCDTQKALTYGSEAFVVYYSSAVKTVKEIPGQVTEHASQIASSVDAWQKQAREAAGQKLKDLGESIQPN